jgi:ATP-dependent DNA helicase RecG
MSRYREALHRISELVRSAAGGAEPLARVLEQTAALSVPPSVRTRFQQAAEHVAAGREPSEALQDLAALLDPEYPARALALPVDRVPGVGPKTAIALARKEIASIEDLLFFLPRAYEDRRHIVTIESLEVGQSACFEGTVTKAETVPLRGRRGFFQATVTDGTGAVNLKWFRGGRHFEQRVRPGVRLLVSGDVRRYRFSRELTHPEVEVLDEDASAESLPRIIPRYPVVEGLPPRTLRRVAESCVEYAADLVDAYVPPACAAALGLPDVGESLRQVHRTSTRISSSRAARPFTPGSRPRSCSCFRSASPCATTPLRDARPGRSRPKPPSCGARSRPCRSCSRRINSAPGTRSRPIWRVRIR